MSIQAGDKELYDHSETSYFYSLDNPIGADSQLMISTAENQEDEEFIKREETLKYIRALGKQTDISYIRDIINNSNIGIAIYKYIHDQDTFRFDIWSKGLIELTGYSLDEVNLEKLNDEKKQIAQYKQALKSLMGELQHSPENIVYLEKDFYTAGGTIKTVDMVSTGMNRSDGFYILTLFKDITSKKEIERKLKDSEECCKSLVNLLPNPVYLYDGKKIVYVNDSVVRLMNAKDESELIGKRHSDLINMDESLIHSFKRMLDKVIHTNKSIPWDGRLQRKSDGEYLYVSVSVIKIPNSSSCKCMIIVNDLERIRKNEELKRRYDENRRQLEEALEYDKQRTDFFCNLSHELRTPINVILGAAQMSSITMSGYNHLMKDEKLNKYIDIIKQNCMRLIRMTNNLIDITKIDFGYFNMKYVKGDIVSAAEKITMSVSEYAQNKGIQLVFDTDIEEKIIAFDYEKLERILLNLLSNAVKFTESGGYIYVNVKNGHKYVSISVRDTGIGIPENMQDKIFERFVQVDKSLSRNAEGSGIGLALVKSLVEMHEGSISIKSTSGEGSKFTVKIPCFLQENTGLAARAGKNNEECIENVKVEFSDIYY